MRSQNLMYAPLCDRRPKQHARQRDTGTRNALDLHGFSSTMARFAKLIDPQQLADEPVMSDAAADVLVRVMYGAFEVVHVLLMAMPCAYMSMHSL